MSARRPVTRLEQLRGRLKLFPMQRRAEVRNLLRVELRRDLAPLPEEKRPTLQQWVKAYIIYLRVSRAFQRGGIREALARIPSRPASLLGAGLFEARVAAWRLHTVGRTLAGEGLCLQESVAACAGLRALGFPADLVLGAPVLELPESPELLHAWAEIEGRVIDTRADILPQATEHIEILRTGPHQKWDDRD